MRRWCCGRHPRARCGASSSSTTTSPAGWTATRPSPNRRPSARTGGTPGGATSTGSTSSRCRTSGSTRGSPPGTWPFTAITLAHLDPAFAKYQLILICREWFQHPQGALPAYEWDFGDVNPPVHAWAALQVFAIDGARDIDFLRRVFAQAPGQLHLVGQPRGCQRPERLRGRLPRPGQHRPDRPLPPARWLHPRAVRRHRLDGRLRAGHGIYRGRPELVRRARGSGSGAEVPGAFRGHPHGPGPAGPVGRHRRALLRPAGHPLRRHRPGQGALDGRDHPGAGRRGHRRRRAAQRADDEQAIHAVHPA